MTQVTYRPSKAAACPDTTEQFGHSFTAGEAVEVEDEKALAKFRGHPFFEVDSADAVDNDPPGDADELRAVHNGGPRFIIVRGDKDKKVKDGLTKADADAFNALSAEDKEAYVKD